MVNACFECRYISQFKGLIDVINFEIEKTKKGLREEMLVQTGTPFSYWIINGVVDLGFRFALYGWKAKT